MISHWPSVVLNAVSMILRPSDCSTRTTMSTSFKSLSARKFRPTNLSTETRTRSHPRIKI